MRAVDLERIEKACQAAWHLASDEGSAVTVILDKRYDLTCKRLS